jgi:malate synthase
MHGPEECDFTNDLFDAVEDLLGLERHTIKVGVMDEERRTSANLAACIHAVRNRIVFINTGFLDRTGDEIHTSMRAGPMVRKGAMKQSAWIDAYEKRNVADRPRLRAVRARRRSARACGPRPTGCTRCSRRRAATSPPAPTPPGSRRRPRRCCHALHYHATDVFEVASASAPRPGLDALLTLPLAEGANWSEAEIAQELDNNCQGLLGYVVRWVDQGIGCSKVPDLSDSRPDGDRATLRISSQHLANWLLHGVASAGAGDGRAQADGGQGRRAECRRPGLRPDGGRVGQPSRVPRRGGSGVQGPRPAQRLYRAAVACLAKEGEGHLVAPPTTRSA